MKRLIFPKIIMVITVRTFFRLWGDAEEDSQSKDYSFRLHFVQDQVYCLQVLLVGL